MEQHGNNLVTLHRTVCPTDHSVTHLKGIHVDRKSELSCTTECLLKGGIHKARGQLRG